MRAPTQRILILVLPTLIKWSRRTRAAKKNIHDIRVKAVKEITRPLVLLYVHGIATLRCFGQIENAKTAHCHRTLFVIAIKYNGGCVETFS